MAKEAGKLVKSRKGWTFRSAADRVNEKYADYGISVSHVLVHRYLDEEYEPKPRGKSGYLPAEFNERLAQWIRAMRALKFPIFKETVLASANYTLEGTTHLQKFKHKQLGQDWYYRFLKAYDHIFTTSSQRPLEMARHKWATAENIGNWYEMIAEILVEKGVASRNPDYKVDAKAGTAEAEPIFLTKPDRIVSFDESRIELDMTQATKAKESRIVIDKTAPSNSRAETLANKGGLCGTGVGGSTASGKALPALFIFASGSIDPSWCTPSPYSDFIDSETGSKMKAKFTCNAKGGVRDCVGVQYLSDVIVPCFPDLSEENPIVLICDGHGSHLTLELLEYCRAHHVHIVLRVPHTTHLIQGEDVRNFKALKSELRLQKQRVLTQNIAMGIIRLRNEDFMNVVEPAWTVAFKSEVSLKGWRDAGLSPFTKCVWHQLKQEEERRTILNADTINYDRLSLAFGGVQPTQNEEEDQEQEQGESGQQQYRRLSSVELYSMGPVTADRAYNLVRERRQNREQQRAEKQTRAAERASRLSQRGQECLTLFNSLTLTSQFEIKQLKVEELKAILHCVDGGNKDKHKAMKSKSQLQEYVLQLPAYAQLPLGNSSAAGPSRVRQPTKTKKRRREDEESVDSESDSDDSVGGDAQQYTIDYFIEARKVGRSHQILVRWEGYGSDEDTWESVSSLRETSNDMVEEFMARMKAT